MGSLSACGIQRSVLRKDLFLAHFLLRTILSITDIDECHKPVQMPFLALERDLMGNHPVVDDLCRNDLIA